jgi:uncharacterized membrane protein YdjX (TVP38/TMEM64 family)
MVLVGVIGVAWLVAGSGSFSLEALEDLLRAHPVVAPLLFVAAHIIAAVAFIPCSPFTLLAGFLWSQPYGLLLSIAAALSASCATFLLARYLWPAQLRPEFAGTPLQRLLALSSRHGWSLVAFAHLNPALPSSTLGYAFGLSAIPFRTYILSALLAMLPLQIALVMLGRAVRQVLLSEVWMAVGVSLAIALAALGLWYWLRRGSLGSAKTKGESDDGNT